ncbi:MAG: XdhC family protein [Hyphomicrobiaceae bacterium]
MKRTDIERLQQAITDREQLALVTWLATGAQKVFEHPNTSDMDADLELSLTLSDAFNKDRSTIATIDGDDVFINVCNPPLRMIIIGAVHIAQELIPMARQLGYEVLVIDPRTAFASEERFAGVKRDTRWPDEALAEIGVDSRTAFIALTHDPKIDDPALRVALGAKPFYIGALGGRRTNEKRVERLTAAGIPASDMARINAPVGLDIGAIGAPEIAVSVIAQLTAALRGKLTPKKA